MNTLTPPVPEVGQLWRDNDPRVPTRYLEITAIEDGKAVCDTWYVGDSPVTVRTVRIRLDRFRPTHTGYVYLGPAWPAPNRSTTTPAVPSGRPS